MEVLQCDGCDFRAESYDELKAHIQDVHTAFIQPTEVGDGTPRSGSLNSLSQTEEDDEDLGTMNNHYKSTHKDSGLHSLDTALGQLSSSSQMIFNQSVNQPSKPANQFFQCRFCVRYFRSKSLLNEHTRKIHRVIGTASLSSENLPSSQISRHSNYNVVIQEGLGKVFSCQYCTYKSPRRARILKHQNMFHKDTLLDSPGSPSVMETEAMAESDALSPEEQCDEEVPEDIIEHTILDSMVKRLSKSRGNLTCEWCGYQTLRKERWHEHMIKKHRNMLKIMSSLKQVEGDGSAGSSKSDSPSSPRSTPTSNLISNDLSGNEDCGFKESTGSPLVKSTAYQCSQLSAKVPNSTGSSILSERSTFVMSDMSNSANNMGSTVLEDSRSSSDDELCDMDDPNYTDSLSAEDSTKLLLSEEDNKMLETKGIPFKRHMNRFQCPFCSFLTMHRRSISRHIENIHLSGKAKVYKCNECPFICTSQLKLGAHKQCHAASSSEWDTMDLTNESPGSQVEATEPMNGGNSGSKINGKEAIDSNESSQQNPHCCTLCNFSTTSLKGLRVHQQHKHSYCDMQTTSKEVSSNEQLDSESEMFSTSNFVQKTQTSILGFSSKKHLIGKTARKSINDLPLDLSPVKKRTRIDEIANNLQSKISQSQQQEDLVINLEEMDDDEDEEGHIDIDRDKDDSGLQGFTYNLQHLYMRESGETTLERSAGKRKQNFQSKRARNIPIQVTLSDDEDNENIYSAEPKDFPDQSSQDSRDTFQEAVEYSEEQGNLFYCKHCDYQNKSARSVSTHYQRMHPYIKFSFRYILDPEDQSAVFRCLECYIEYTSFDDLSQHYMDHHPEASNVLNFNQPDLVYMCRFCSYTSPNVRSLMPHYQRMHPTVKINNAMIFSSYMVDQPQKSAESQTLREILNSGPKNFASSTPVSRSPSSPALKSISKTPESSVESETIKESVGGNIVVYDCDMCSFASPNMHSVLVHYQKKHPEQKASYFRIQKAMRVISLDRNQSSSSSSYNLPNLSKSSNIMPLNLDDEVFYCKHCVYSNRSVVGVLVHYQKRHPEIKVTAKYIKHAPPTPALLKLMDELQIAPPKQFLKQLSNNGTDGSSISQSRVGSDKGEGEMLFFCQHCDYGNRTVKGVLIHYQKKHRDVRANADLVRRHTAVVRTQRERAQMIQTGSSAAATSASTSDTDASRTLRSLKCRHCSYTSPYVYALKKHLKKDHHTVKATSMTILRWAYQDGILEAGYHCEWCIYSHAEPSGLLMHYQRRHPEHNVDYTYMASKLWAGPDATASRQGGNSDTKHYQCRDCAYEACSIWDITNHYQAVHPWAIKEDETVLLDIIKGNKAPGKIHSAVTKGHIVMSSSFNSLHADCEDGIVDVVSRQHQERHSQLSFTTTSISNNPYQCTVCLSEYNSLHGLLTHYGKKHPGMKVKAADFAQEADINPSSVYKCRHCPYVNSRIHGVLTHYQKRHPLVKVTAEDFADDIEQVKDLANEGDEKCKTQRQGYGAYRCKMCPYTHGTLEKLKIHYEKYHNQPASDMFKPATMPFPPIKDDQLAECSATSVSEVQEVSGFDLTVSQLDKVEKHTIFRCQLCKYFCSTRKGIARHYRIKHNNVRAQPEGKNNMFKCALCSYTNPIRKGLAAHYQKRHDIDAYYTHCLAASKTLSEKPCKVTLPLGSENEGSGMSEELKLAVDRRKCSLCPFQAFSRKSIVSHYIKRHPGVFPKKQHSSKLGRYFTVIYPKEPEKTEVAEENEVLEVKSEDGFEKDTEWLPFKCLKCFKLSFNTAELLCMHYNDYHSNDFKRDFITVPSPAQGVSDFYQCAHCELKFLALPDLSNHLMNHNEEFQKRVTRHERRKQLQSKQKGAEPAESKQEKQGTDEDKTPIGYRCNFCVEVHPTLRAICNHLRKHVQYGEVKEGHVKEMTEVPLAVPEESIANGYVEDSISVEEAVSVETDNEPAIVAPVAMETEGESAMEGTPMVVPEKERLVRGHPCTQCDRVFMSMQGLRSHERSHSAMALFSREDKYSCQYCQFVSAFRHNLDRHVQSHHGHHKPFRCKLCPFKSAYLSRLKSHLHKAHAGENTYKCLSCSFSTMTISQLKEHSLQVHGETLTLNRLRAGAALRNPRQPSGSTPVTFTPEEEATVGCPDPVAVMQPKTLMLPPESFTDETSLWDLEQGFLEPADIQQQLSHYQLASKIPVSSSPEAPSGVMEAHPDGILTCEFCDFSSGYMQSLRRHYRDRHGGKKLFKCKDCTFFTCNKSTFTIHVEAGHSNTPEEIPKDLCCPFCLYHTKYKSNMIDHIVLHREERVVPLEVSRSKLSRHLQGMVFRCHKCTFTCSSDESLQLHLHKHEELKPYQCQLCYFDSKQKEELENHLRDEHKVIRNFELMGRVNLDQLDALREKDSNLSSAEEEEGDDLHDEEEDKVEEDKVNDVEDYRRELRDEDEPEKLEPKEVPGSPSSLITSICSEKRFPCEFCGRSFTHSVEWERHVLRHGMSFDSRSDGSFTPAIGSTAQPPMGSAAVTMDGEENQSSCVMEVERGHPSDLLNSNVQEEEDNDMLETKNDP
ncbi:zinc finger protein 462 isoform X1 [Denticeps clupeoides]|uniref:zinc finger protein 462 isoform X1 n=1 Tax=Denticeps clupeoides TaxID=299321 RepID=UPI0010A2B5C3|nr:zinc finger protein 462 isoform X1 [Denticeps clupeoides]